MAICYDCVLAYGYTVRTNSEKNIALYFWWQDELWCVLLKAIVPKSMIQAKKMLPGAEKCQILMFFSRKMLEMTVFYVAVNCINRKNDGHTII